eukprot:4490048-Prorocentrum_lima.AAC.1
MDPRLPTRTVRELKLQVRLERHLAPAQVAFERAIRLDYINRLAALGDLLNTREMPMIIVEQ